MSCQEFKFQQHIKKAKATETHSSSHCLSRRACVSLVSPLCSGGAVSTSSMADPASLPLAAVSVSASNSRHSTRKRSNPTQPTKAETKRPRTRSQDTAAPQDTASTATDNSTKRGKNKHNSSNNADSSSRKGSLRNSKNIPDKDHSATHSSTVVNNKVHNNHQNTTSRNKISVSLIEAGTSDTHHKSTNKRPQSAGGYRPSADSEPSSKIRRSSKAEPGTSHWDISSSKKPRPSKSKDTKSLDADSSFHKYPLRSQVRLSTADNPERSILDEQPNHKASAISKKKHKVIPTIFK